MLDTVNQFGASLMGPTLWAVVWSLIKIVALLLPLMGCVAYLTLWERKGIGFTQMRPGPNRVGPLGLLHADRRRGEADVQGDHPSRPRPTSRCSSSAR